MQIRFSEEDTLLKRASFEGSGITNEADQRSIRDFMTNNMINSSFCDDLKLKDMSISIRGSCIGREVKIGRNV